MRHYNRGIKGGHKEGPQVKTRRDYSKSQNEEKLNLGMEIFSSGESMRKAADKAGIPFSVLQRHLAQPNMKKKCGRKPALDPQITANFATMCQDLADMMFGRIRVVEYVQ